MKKRSKNKRGFVESQFHYINERGEEVIIPEYPTRMTKEQRLIYEDNCRKHWEDLGILGDQIYNNGKKQ